MAFTLDDIKKFASNPSSIPAPGKYGEGAVVYSREMLDTLKSAVQDGKLSLVDYQGLAAPIVKNAQSRAMAAGGQGGSGATWQSIVSDGFANAAGKIGMPFSNQEYAKLPDNVLPTQSDVNSGMFDPTGAPLQRFQKAPTPAVNPGPGTPGTTAGNNSTTTPGVETPNSQTGNSPVYTANPNDPPPYGGLQSTNADGSYDAQRIAQEAALQQQLATQNQEGITSQRQKYLSDLTGLINQNTNKQMSEATPGIFEELNSKGLLRSSELGNQLATKAKSLNADASNQLAQYGIQGETSDLGNLQNIQQTYNAGRNSALSREFSVEDYNKQVQTGKEMGEEYAKLAPQAPSTKSQMEVAGVQGATQGATAKAGKK